jgi:hypothetical protein
MLSVIGKWLSVLAVYRNQILVRATAPRNLPSTEPGSLYASRQAGKLGIAVKLVLVLYQGFPMSLRVVALLAGCLRTVGRLQQDQSIRITTPA